MSRVYGSAEEAEVLRQTVIKKYQTVLREGSHIGRSLKDMEDLYGQKPLAALRSAYNDTILEMKQINEELAAVLIQLQNYRDFLAAIEAEDREDGAGAEVSNDDLGPLAGKVVEIPTRTLPADDVNTFWGGKYRSVRTTAPVQLWRVYGGKAQQYGPFLTTHRPSNALAAKMNLALDTIWKNTRTKCCQVTIPAGTIFEIGKAGGQLTYNDQLLPGTGDQILLDRDLCREHHEWFGQEEKLDVENGYLKFDDAAQELEKQS